MSLHLVQIANGSERRVALVREPKLVCLAGVRSIYELALTCIHQQRTLTDAVDDAPTGEELSYDDVYAGTSAWRLLSPIDVPGAPSRVLVAGTGLTHLGSARQRQAMHLADAAKTQQAAEPTQDPPATDSMRMFQWGLESGRPAEGTIGIAPEWFYKGDAAVLKAPFAPIEIPAHGEDGGEEAELAGVYLIGDDGTPYRLGIAQGNEFSDHKFEKRNYLNLAGSKLRSCSLGPELVIGAAFRDVHGTVKVTRGDQVLWQKDIATGEDNMCHSLANLEHHHFKFAGHRQPGNVHVHFYGADALSFGAGIELHEGDMMEVHFAGFGRPLRNPVHEEDANTKPVRVRAIA